MSTSAVVIIVLVVMLVFGLLVILGLRISRATTGNLPLVGGPERQSGQGQGDRGYSPLPQEQQTPSPQPNAAAQHSDPRKKPLPRCPRCKAAIGYDEKVCPKCHHQIRPQ